MSPYEHIKPRFVREWYLKLKARMKLNKSKKDAETLALETNDPTSQSISPTKHKTDASPKHDSEKDSYEDNGGHEQSEYNDMLADQIEFSDDEDVEEDGGITIKNAAQYLAYKPPANKKGRQSNRVDESKYFEAIARQAPDVTKGRQLNKKKANLVTDF